MSTTNPIIGIDLGTSTSAIAILQNGRPELLQDEQGDRVIPSVVQLSPSGELLVGSVAKHGAVALHDRTIQEVKRLMGTPGAVITLGEQTFSPEEISALILGHLKTAAEAKLGPGTVRDVVISVPARFENEAREATRRAAERAGLHVLRLINEPTAAALSYGLDKLRNKEKVLVFDWGGGTLDVSILEMFDGVLDVKTSVGDDQLGGKDVDDLLVACFRELYQEQHDGAVLPAGDLRAAQMLKEEAEEAKKQLSFAQTALVDLPYLSPGGGINLTLTRSRLEDLLEGLLSRALKLVDEALGRAKLQWSDIDVVLPVGGSSRIALFRRVLEMRWGKPIREGDNPDEAVAKGTAVAAGIEQKVFDADKGIMILDVSPHRLGVAVIRQVGPGQFVDDYFSEIIPKDAKLPAVARRDYDTQFHTKNAIAIRVFEATSDSNLCRDHRLISELPLSNITQSASGEIVQVEFRYTLDGILDVAAHYHAIPAVRVEGQFSTSRTTNTGASADAAVAAAAARCAALLAQAERVTATRPAHAARIQITVDALRAALAAGDTAATHAGEIALTDLLFELA